MQEYQKWRSGDSEALVAGFFLLMNFTISYQATESKPIPKQNNISVNGRAVNWKKLARGFTKIRRAIMASVIKIISGTRLFLYLRVVSIE